MARPTPDNEQHSFEDVHLDTNQVLITNLTVDFEASCSLST